MICFVSFIYQLAFPFSLFFCLIHKDYKPCKGLWSCSSEICAASTNETFEISFVPSYKFSNKSSCSSFTLEDSLSRLNNESKQTYSLAQDNLTIAWILAIIDACFLGTSIVLSFLVVCLATKWICVVYYIVTLFTLLIFFGSKVFYIASLVNAKNFHETKGLHFVDTTPGYLQESLATANSYLMFATIVAMIVGIFELLMYSFFVYDEYRWGRDMYDILQDDY